MSQKLFNKNEVKRLSTNSYVKTVSEKGITYTDEFKRLFIAEYETGMLPRQIFEVCGFDVEILGMDRVHSAAKRWRSAYRRVGLVGLQDTRKGNSGRPSESELSLEEKYARLEAQNNLLKAENELLKKLEMAERRMRKKSK
ncbi:tranposase [Paenibacillus glacialis]|uniref:Tranposase n=1 Tax=Paenibacillus glacialis TaxID=494026 RepID=A0A168KQZ1_9BACL|nr:tranposase [Paenibacillus glacialis]